MQKLTAAQEALIRDLTKKLCADIESAITRNLSIAPPEASASMLLSAGIITNAALACRILNISGASKEQIDRTTLLSALMIFFAGRDGGGTVGDASDAAMRTLRTIAPAIIGKTNEAIAKG